MRQAALVGASATALAAAGCAHTPPKGPRRLAMVIDLVKCNGCDSCSVSCKAEFNVRLGGFRSWVNKVESGTFPDVARFFLPRLCNHCETSSCSQVCPTGATYERPDGIVMIDKDKCIGCRYCMTACPYGARYFNWTNEPAENGDMARTPGVVDKCDFCVHRVDEGLEPSCVQTCPPGARVFGDINDPQSEISTVLRTRPTQTLFPEQGTTPRVYYIGLDEVVEQGAPEGGR